ncbi:LOW QUALITY PROTEIN: uncharacterized protein [Panulirus ornatus]|uniref:LOW QUALITY PROTEIN: uncharacterized protein n=1 Tax=Panulirus ornatus TaxID=150431 RepID=UPI003A8AC6F0
MERSATSKSPPLPSPGVERVLFLQESGTPSALSYARLATPFPALTSFSVCYWLRLNRFREESTLMSYALSDDKDNELRMDHRLMEYKVALHSWWAETKLETPFRYWSHFCFTYHHGSGTWNIFMDGSHQAMGSLPIVAAPLQGNGAYIIGQEQDSFGGGFQQDQSFSGEITQLNFWSRVLDHLTIRKLAQCEEEMEGDALGWMEQSWNISGEVSWRQQLKEDICQKARRQITIFPDRFSLIAAQHLCKVVGGNLSVPQTNKENTWVYESSKERADFCSGGQGSSYLWLGANDHKDERQWVYWQSGLPIPWEGPWRGSGPNGGIVENCLVMLTGTFPGRWSDIACLDSYEFCVPCEFTKMSKLYLKGPAICRNSPFNREYALGADYGLRPSLNGYFHSDIIWDPKNFSWVIQSRKVEEAVAFWKPLQEGMYPFGTKSWVMAGKVCQLSVGAVVNLTLSVCGEGEFTCADGTCIKLSQRCDLRVDCPDQSDEAQCSIVDVPQGYRHSIPPPPTTEGDPLDILFLVDLIAFPSIVTQDLIFDTTLSLHLRWKDIRLNYLNLHDDRTLNLLSRESVESIWTPRVFFSNAQGNVFTNLGQGARVECIRQGPSQPGPPDLTHEMNIFSGQENSLEMGQLYTATYNCDFDLVMFPFDTQVCSLHFTLVSAAASYMVLVPTVANYSGPKDLIEYTIGRVTMEALNEGEFSTLRVDVRFIRRYEFYLLTLYIPTTLLIAIAYASFFFNPEDFNSRIVVALTALLVLSSLFTQTSNSLPKTSYFKLVDVWLFFSIVIIFVVVMLQTLIDFSSDKQWFVCSKNRNSSVIQILEKQQSLTDNSSGLTFPRVKGQANLTMLKFGQAIIPIIFLIFNLAYWGSALA